MIEINLLPQELKIKGKKFALEPRYFFYLVPIIFCLLVFIHLYLAGVCLIKNHQFNRLNNQWQKFSSQRETLEKLKKEYGILSADARFIQQLTAQRIYWSQKLNKLSLKLPAGIWFNEITVTPRNFVLKGSVVSLQKMELALINKFMDELKKDTDFFKNFSNLQLGTIDTQVIADYTVVNFILTATLKAQ